MACQSSFGFGREKNLHESLSSDEMVVVSMVQLRREQKKELLRRREALKS